MTTAIDRVRRGGVVLGLTIIIAVVGYHWLGRTWLEALYMTVITIGTIGYGESSTVSDLEKVFTIGVIFVGLASWGYTIGGLLNLALAGELDRALGHQRMSKAIEKLHDHVIICGFGRIGQILGEELKRRHTDVIVVDLNPERTALATAAGLLAYTGDATEEEVLIAMGVQRAKTLVAAFPNDAANVFITLTSRDLNRKLQIIARAEQPSTQKKLMQAGADRVVLPASIGAQRIASIITRPSALEFMELVAGRSVMDVEVDELTIPATNPLIGRSVFDAESRRRHGLLVVAVKRHEGSMIFNPDSDFVFAAGDTMIVMGKPDDLQRFRQENLL